MSFLRSHNVIFCSYKKENGCSWDDLLFEEPLRDIKGKSALETIGYVNPFDIREQELIGRENVIYFSQRCDYKKFNKKLFNAHLKELEKEFRKNNGKKPNARIEPFERRELVDIVEGILSPSSPVATRTTDYILIGTSENEGIAVVESNVKRGQLNKISDDLGVQFSPLQHFKEIQMHEDFVNYSKSHLRNLMMHWLFLRCVRDEEKSVGLSYKNLVLSTEKREFTFKGCKDDIGDFLRNNEVTKVKKLPLFINPEPTGKKNEKGEEELGKTFQFTLKQNSPYICDLSYPKRIKDEPWLFLGCYSYDQLKLYEAYQSLVDNFVNDLISKRVDPLELQELTNFNF